MCKRDFFFGSLKIKQKQFFFVAVSEMDFYQISLHFFLSNKILRFFYSIKATNWKTFKVWWLCKIQFGWGSQPLKSEGVGEILIMRLACATEFKNEIGLPLLQFNYFLLQQKDEWMFRVVPNCLRRSIACVSVIALSN